VFIGLSLDHSFLRPSWLSDLTDSSLTKIKRCDLNLTRVETYPIGGGILAEPFRLGDSSGPGAFLGVDGLARIAFNADSRILSFHLSLFRC
jgi:hypothetical protein